VTGGLLLGAAVITWIGASRYFEQGSLYTTYFDESVQGLQVDSRVKYRGVDIGKVQRIDVAADRKLVEVVIKVDLEGGLGQDVVTQLRAAGITGIVFIELDRKNPNDPLFLPPRGIRSAYPVIPSQTSQTKQILSSMDRIMERLEQVDLRGISDQVKQTSRAIEGFFTAGKLPQVMTNIERATAGLESSLRRIDRILAEERVNGLLDESRQGIAETRQGIAETRQGLAEARQGVAETRQGVAETRQGIAEARQGITEARRLVTLLAKEVEALRPGEVTARAASVIEGLDRRTRRLGRDLELTTDDVRQTIESLKLLIEELRANPSELLFSRPRTDDQFREGR
jgi:phospholipid/cholesterol/gamma-HCH transport system substrate-binding protein